MLPLRIITFWNIWNRISVLSL